MLACLFAAQAHAQAPVEARSSAVLRYPAGSIRSVQDAEAALADVRQEQAEAEARYLAEQQACHPKFFATSCIEQAKERRRQALSAVRPVELEANTFKRKKRLAEREQALAERLAKDEHNRSRNAGQGVPEEATALPAPAAARPDEPEPQEQSAPLDDRQAQHDAKRQRREAEEMANAGKRAANIAAYEKKQRDAEARQRKVAERKAEKERKRLEREPAQAAD